MKKILFVCTGNTCRSPMAEGFLKSRLESEPSFSEEFSAASAGIFAYEGDEASSEAINVMRSDWDLDISGHRAAALTDKHIGDSNLILTMTRDQKNHIVSSYPGAAGKTFTLKEFADDKNPLPFSERHGYSLDISDPYGKPPQYYKQCANEIKQAVAGLVEKLKKSR